MRRYTERYHKARLAEARPIFLLFLGTDRGLRCFGKHTPTPEQIGTELSVLEWSARVLTFGDFRQSLSSDSDSVFTSLFEEEVSSYNGELDNADGYFSRIAGKEIFLNGDVFLYQGFEYPDFEFDDFQSFFSGKVSTFELDKLRFRFTATSAAQIIPEDVTFDTSKVYALSTGGVGDIGAQKTFDYTETDPVFYEETWTYTTEITITTTGTLQILLDVANDKYNNTRYQIGIDANNKLFFKYAADVDTATPTYNTLTSDVTLGTGDTRIEVEYDGVNGNVTFRDNTGQVSIIDLTPVGSGFVLDTSWSVTNSIGIAVNSIGNIYVTDSTNDRIEVYNSTGVLQTTFGSSGTGDGQFQGPTAIAIDGNDNIYVTDARNHNVQKFDSSHVFQIKWGSFGSGDGQFDVPSGICVSPDNSNVYVSDTDNDRIQYFSPSGSFQGKLGSAGSGTNQFNTPIGCACDSLGNVYLADSLNDRIVKLNSSLAWQSTIGSSGSGDGQLNRPQDVSLFSNYIYVSDLSNNRIQKLNTSGTFQYKYIGLNPYGIAYHPTTGHTYIIQNGASVYKFSETAGFLNFDGSDTGSDDTITVSKDFDGKSVTSGLGGFQLVNTNPTNTVFQDIGEGLDLLLIDGTWTEVLTLQFVEQVTVTKPLDPLDDIILPTTDNYSTPGPNQQNVVLPFPYGGLRENSDGGVWVAPLINQDDFVYCVAGWPIQSVANGNTIQVYVDGVETSSGWTFSESNDYEGKGEIALLTFTSDPGGIVTVKCNGKWVNEQLLTNPVDIIEDFLDWAASLSGNSTWQKDETSFAQSKALTTSIGYRAAGIIQSNNSIGYWLKAILKSFLGNFRFNAAGKIELSFQPLEQSESIQEELLEYEAITIKAKQLLDNICGRIIVNYAISYAEVDRRFKNNATTSYFRTADKSQSAINPQSWELDFDWCRNTSNIELMQDILLALYADPEYIVDYQGQDFKFVPLNLLDQMSADISFLLNSSGTPVQDVLYSLRHKTVNLDNFSTTLSMQSINFVTVSNPDVFNLTIDGENITIGGEQITIGAS